MNKWLLGYNTTGFNSKRSLEEMISLLAEIGFRSVEISLLPGLLHPATDDIHRLQSIRHLLEQYQMNCVLSVGHPLYYSFDPFLPTLHASNQKERERALILTTQAISLGKTLGAKVLSLHSGYAETGMTPSQCFEILIDSLKILTKEAAQKSILLALEYNPGMLINSYPSFLALREKVGAELYLTLDIGHSACVDDCSPQEIILRAKDLIKNIHCEDIRDKKDFHLPMGCGEINFRAVFNALETIGYQGPLHYEYCSPEEVEQGLAEVTFQQISPFMERKGK